MHDPVTPDVDFPALEEAILGWWQEGDIPRKALTHREGAPEFVFYEGPPFANAPPAVHSVLPRALKDIYTRFRCMKGFHVPRKGGWDCHGLPAELEIEKRLGFTEKKQIVEYGVARFNELCRRSVTEYIDNYVRFSERISFWLDYEHAYQTMSNEYIESVWWSLAELHGRGVLFEADRVAPYCPRCETPLSDHELGQEDVYQEVSDPGVTVAFPFLDAPTVDGVSLEGVALAVWTTTPWTLLSNLAAAVHPDISYALVEWDGRRLLIAKPLVTAALGLPEGADGPPELGRVRGRDLVGLRYRPPFEYAARAFASDPDAAAAAEANAWRVLAADFVNVDEGSGVVHLAAAFGADDLESCRDAGIPIFNPVDQSGRFDGRIPEFAGTFVKAADPDIIERLRATGTLLRAETYRHTYPHCWRCRSPLLYYALTSWYVRTTAFRERLLEVNKEVNWVPEHIRDGRFGNWLENNVDWSLSRFRFWGTPLPIWRCPNRHDTAVGSVAALSKASGRDLGDLDLHRPWVDEVTFPCADCGEEARRVSDVIDVWYDSGAMPFAQHGYPHTGEQVFRHRFPADFIAEAIDQTRGWFYTLMAESVLLFDQTPYRNVVCHGLVVDGEGRKMSKSIGNVIDPWDVFARFGSDALRFYFFSSGPPGNNKRVSDAVLEQVVRGPFLTLWHVYRLYVLYANIDEFHPGSWPDIAPGLRPSLDRWLLSELHQLIVEVDEALSMYDSLRASRRIAEFIDDLSNWYVRRSRRRFWREARTDEQKADKAAAYWTLWTCLGELSKLLAPFTPFLAEAMYRNLVVNVNDRAPESVHLVDFPAADAGLIDPRYAAGMSAARELVRLGRSARDDAGIKVRQPLRRAVLLVPPDLEDVVAELADHIAEELNIGEVSFAEEAGALVHVTLRPNFRQAGPAFGEKVQALAKALAAVGPVAADVAATLESGQEVDIDIDGAEILRVGPEHVEIRREPAHGTAFAFQAPFGVSLDLEVTPELRREGLAREFIHCIQAVRKDADLDVTDRIALWIAASGDIGDALHEHRRYVAEELLADEIDVHGPESRFEGDLSGAWERTVPVDGVDVRVVVRRA